MTLHILRQLTERVFIIT